MPVAGERGNRQSKAMTFTRDRIERCFESFARLIVGNRLKAILLTALLTAAPLSQLPGITMDTSTEGFLHEDDLTLLQYNAFRKQFGRDEMLIMAVTPPEIFNQNFLHKLRAFHEDIEASVPHVEDITSLMNARSTRGEEDELIVEDLLEDWPHGKDGLEALRSRALSNPIYRNLLLSEDGKTTTVVVKTDAYSGEVTEEDILAGFEEEGHAEEGPDEREFLSDAENSAVVSAAREVIGRHNAADFPIRLAGSPVVTDTLKRSMINDMQKFTVLAVVTIALFLFAMFRRISGVVLPIIVVVLSLLSTLGIMAFAGVPIKPPTQILFSFILAVGVGDSVHVLAIFFRRLKQTGRKEEAIAYTFGHSGLAILMTSLTTAGGLLSFAAAEVAPIADLGIFASAGVMVALTYTVVLLPALLATLPISRGKEGKVPGRSPFDRLLAGIGDFTTGRPKGVLAAGALILMISLLGVSKIKFSHYVLGWLPEDMDVRRATEKIDRELRGSISMEVVVDTGRENGLHEPETLKKLDDLGRRMQAYDDGRVFVGKTLSVADILKEIHMALNENRQEYYAVPEGRALIAQEFLLFENSGSDDLEDFVDSQFSKARFTAKVPFRDALAYWDFMDASENMFQSAFAEDAKITVTGMLPLLSRTLHNVMLSMRESYILAFVVISILMVLLIGDLKVGMLSMIPNLTPIVLTMGIMGFAGFPMDMFTMLVGSIAIGLAVDDTIHFMHNFRRYFKETGDAGEAVHLTLLGTGRAMFITSCVLSTGFFIFMFSSLNNLFRFGLLTGLAIILALLADFLIAPALMVLATGRKAAAAGKGWDEKAGREGPEMPR
jgi:predicted RND superfamily exporter protein